MKKIILLAVTAGALALFSGFTPAQAQVASSDQVLFGITYFKNELIRIDTTTGVGTLVGNLSPDELGYGLTSYNGGLYTFSATSNSLDQISRIDGRVTSSTSIGVMDLAGEGDLVIADTGVGFLASAFDSTGAPTHPLYRFDVTTGTSVLLGDTSVGIDGLALDHNTPQTLYALGQGDSGTMDPATVDAELYTVDQATGVLTPIGPIGVPKNSPIAGMTFSSDGTLYAAIDDKLYTLDTTTGAATIVDAATPDFSFSSVSGLAFENGASVLANLSSRALVMGGGEDVLITGFIITDEDSMSPPVAPATKEIVMRGLGPSLKVAGQALSGTLGDPTLSLRDANGTEIASNDNWKQNTPADQMIITNAGLAPGNPLESVIVANLPTGEYTAILKGSGNGNGLALEEIYDINEGNGLKTANLSARAMVTPGSGALISGMIVEGSLNLRTLIRGLGPSLKGKVSDPLPDPLLMAYDGNGNLIDTNDSWMQSPEAADIMSSGLAPTDPNEAVIDRVFAPGAYTIVLTGKGADPSGTALIEAYDRNTSQ
ncbi:MAG: hypothetical protein ABI233_02830 [Chthoniobacterales bacterium]